MLSFLSPLCVLGMSPAAGKAFLPCWSQFFTLCVCLFAVMMQRLSHLTELWILAIIYCATGVLCGTVVSLMLSSGGIRVSSLIRRPSIRFQLIVFVQREREGCQSSTYGHLDFPVSTDKEASFSDVCFWLLSPDPDGCS